MPHRLTILRDSFELGYVEQILSDDGKTGQINNKIELKLTIDSLTELGIVTSVTGDFEDGLNISFDTSNEHYLANALVYQLQSEPHENSDLLETISVYILDKWLSDYNFSKGKGVADGGCDFFGLCNSSPAEKNLSDISQTFVPNTILGQCKLHSHNSSDASISSNARDLIGTESLFALPDYFDRWTPADIRDRSKLMHALANPNRPSLLILIYIGGRDRWIHSELQATNLITIGPSEFSKILVSSGLIKQLQTFGDVKIGTLLQDFKQVLQILGSSS